MDDSTESSDCLEYMPEPEPEPAPEFEPVTAGRSVVPSLGGGEYIVWGAGWVDDDEARLKQGLIGADVFQDSVSNRGAGQGRRE
jgi:hypothetical protein